MIGFCCRNAFCLCDMDRFCGREGEVEHLGGLLVGRGSGVGMSDAARLSESRLLVRGEGMFSMEYDTDGWKGRVG